MRAPARPIAIACGALLAVAGACGGGERERARETSSAPGPRDEPDAGMGRAIDAGARGRCAAHELDCTGVCVEPDSDPNFCGATGDCVGPYRGERCDAPERCIAGECTLVCAQGEVNCGGRCVDPAVQRCLRWSEPRALAPAELGNTGRAQLAVDGAGNAIALFVTLGWNDIGTGLYAVRYEAGSGEWSAPELLSLPREDGETAIVYTHALGLDGAGNALVVWSQATASERIDLWSRRFDAASASWEPAALAESDPVDADSAWLHVQPNGDAIVIWRRFDDIHATTWWNRYDGARAAWRGEQPIGFALEFWNDFGIDFGADADGNVFAAWEDFWASDGVSLRVQRFDVAAGVWSQPITVAEPGVVSLRDLRWAVRPSGDALLVWRELNDGDTLRSVTYARPDDAWSEPLEVAVGTPYLDWQGEPVVDVDGATYLAWREFGGDERPDATPVVSARLPADGRAWEVAQVAAVIDAVPEVHAAVAAGEQVVIWSRWREGFSALEAVRFDAASGTWSAPVRLETRMTDEVRWVTAGAGAEGTLVTLWERRTYSTAAVVASVLR